MKILLAASSASLAIARISPPQSRVASSRSFDNPLSVLTSPQRKSMRQGLAGYGLGIKVAIENLR